MIITILITLVYSLIIGVFIAGFDRVKAFKPVERLPKNSFSIIIPFRNEAQNLPELLESLKKLIYPKEKYEIIFIDDDSQDNSIEIIKSTFENLDIPFKILKNIRHTNSPKKDAIQTALEQTQHEWIITTDADCEVPKNWLTIFDSFIQLKQPKMIVAPVTYTKSTSFFERFQILDFLSLQGTTIGAFGINQPFLCNGANLCYSKATFNEVKGFAGNSEIASGDDIFLLEKIYKKHPRNVHYLKNFDALVKTKPQPTFKELLYQRIRWAAKSTGYNNTFSKLVALSVFAMNASIVILFILSILGYNKWLYLFYTFLVKYIVDAFLLFRISYFFNQKRVLSSFFASSFIYPFFSMFVVIASLTSSFQWKGRKFKK